MERWHGVGRGHWKPGWRLRLAAGGLEDGCRNSYKSEGVLPVSAGGEVRA